MAVIFVALDGNLERLSGDPCFTLSPSEGSLLIQTACLLLAFIESPAFTQISKKIHQIVCYLAIFQRYHFVNLSMIQFVTMERSRQIYSHFDFFSAQLGFFQALSHIVRRQLYHHFIYTHHWFCQFIKTNFFNTKKEFNIISNNKINIFNMKVISLYIRICLLYLSNFHNLHYIFYNGQK